MGQQLDYFRNKMGLDFMGLVDHEEDKEHFENAFKEFFGSNKDISFFVNTLWIEGECNFGLFMKTDNSDLFYETMVFWHGYRLGRQCNE